MTKPLSGIATEAFGAVFPTLSKLMQLKDNGFEQINDVVSALERMGNPLRVWIDAPPPEGTPGDLSIAVTETSGGPGNYKMKNLLIQSFKSGNDETIYLDQIKTGDDDAFKTSPDTIELSVSTGVPVVSCAIESLMRVAGPSVSMALIRELEKAEKPTARSRKAAARQTSTPVAPNRQ